MLNFCRRLLAVSLVCGFGLCAAQAGAAQTVASIEVDAREAARGVERVHLELPVKPGKLTLIYPKWLPGEHAPDGPIGSVAGLKFTANGQSLAWRRDDTEMYAFHLSIPPNVSVLDVAFEVDSLPESTTPPNALRTATPMLAIVLWNQFVLYPAGVQSDDLQIAAKVRLPPGWSLATALPKRSSSGDATQFGQVSLTTLIDSTLIAGRYFKTVALGGTPPVYLHLAADSAAAVEITPETTAQLRKLVEEATAMFGATHYNEYHFLWTLSDAIDFEGIEHHQSSDNRSAERTLIDKDLRRSEAVAMLLPHEYVHSWNGKYRRPIGLATGNYDAPMRGELLWVYEGLTEYLGMVLGARSGLASMADARDSWADVAAMLQARKGREWRPLADTAISAPFSYQQAPEWRERTRGTDFYEESAMLWLEADVLIRSRTKGAKSLNDFCRLFYGPSTPPEVVPYDFNDVVKALNTVYPYDWRGYWTERLNRLRAEAPAEGLTTGGWRLRFDADESDERKGENAAAKRTDFLYSLGFTLKDEGAKVYELLPGSAADKALLAPGSHLIAVDGRKYSKDVLLDALEAGGEGERSIKLLMEQDDMFSTAELRYAGHARYPHLERDQAIPDLLTAVLTPLTQSVNP